MAIVQFDESYLVEALERIAPAFRASFAAACAERLIPGYSNFVARTGEGDPDALRSFLARLWDDLLGNRMSDSELGTMIDACMELVRRANSGPWVTERPVAEDAAAAVAYALRCRRNGQSQEAVWSARRAYEAVDEFVIKLKEIDMNEPGAQGRVFADSLVQAELSRQLRDLEELLGVGSEAPQLIALVRDRARSEGAVLFGPAD